MRIYGPPLWSRWTSIFLACLVKCFMIMISALIGFGIPRLFYKSLDIWKIISQELVTYIRDIVSEHRLPLASWSNRERLSAPRACVGYLLGNTLVLYAGCESCCRKGSNGEVLLQSRASVLVFWSIALAPTWPSLGYSDGKAYFSRPILDTVAVSGHLWPWPGGGGGMWWPVDSAASWCEWAH